MFISTKSCAWGSLFFYMLWFKFILGLVFFELVSILFAIVSDYGIEYMTKANNNWTSFKNFAPKLNLNHNTCTITFAFFSPWMLIQVKGSGIC